jgi:hypothetical protein
LSSKGEAIFITQWKDEMKERIKMRFPDKPLSDKKINKYLDDVIHACMVNPKVVVVNNYREAAPVETDLLSLIDTIHKNDLIIGGGGVLYVQHNTDGRENVLYNYIIAKQGLRNKYKKMRKNYPDDSDEWIYYDILQNATKIIINSLYGVHGYDGFVLYNRFIAESITNIGRQIITTAVMTFENFLSNGVRYNTEEEVYKHLTNVANEYDENMDYSIFDIDDIDHKVVKRLLEVSAFETSDEFIHHLEIMVKGLKYGQKVLLFFKNNLYEFSRLPWIYDKLKYIVVNLKELKAPDERKIDDPTIVEYIHEIWAFYETFVLYDYPIYDRVRKAMFTDRDSVLYVDTDSNFIGLNKWVTFIKDEVLHNEYNKPETEIDFISVNLAAMFLAEVIDRGLHTLCKYMGTHKEHADRLEMKNEFYLSRIMFTENTKKRYVSNSILQEGQLLQGGAGKPDIKGFDFKKAVTKEKIRKIYTSICEDDILRAEKIDVENIYKKVLQLKSDIEESLRRGESEFFKQANVQIIDHYKEPYSTQGVVAVLLWNCLNPQYAMELPTDCDIVPIKELTGPKYEKSRGKVVWKNEAFVLEFKEKFPEAYYRLEKDIYNNSNELIRKMGLTSIAKPKNADVPIPEWFEFLLDTQKVVQDDLDLIAPILRSLGLNGLKTNASTEYITNIIDL